MIQAIGIDAVEIARFAAWHLFSKHSLLKVFTAEEIDYCLSCLPKSAERFAVRFAAKEALYKAACSAGFYSKPLVTLLRFIEIKHKVQGSPYIHLHTTALFCSSFTIYLSLSHTSTTAISFVIIAKL